MNKMIIMQYINKVTEDDIYNFGLKQGIEINKNDICVIYDYIKNKNERIFDNPQGVLCEIKDKIDINVYNVLLELYDKYKNYIK